MSTPAKVIPWEELVPRERAPDDVKISHAGPRGAEFLCLECTLDSCIYDDPRPQYLKGCALQGKMMGQHVAGEWK